MRPKKNPKSNLENYRKLFMQLGLVLSLFIVYVSIEHKTYDRVIDDLEGVFAMGDDEEDIPIVEKIEPLKPPPPPPPPPPAPEVIEVVEDDKEVEETVIESTETNEEEAIEVEEIEEVEEVEDVIEDVPFAIIEDVPIYPGCERGNNSQKKLCFQKKVQAHVNRRFDGDLAADLGLSSGRKRIMVMFKIDKTGNITGVRARAPHKKLQQEAERVIKSLPRMVPGKQRGRAVAVTYTLPIVFNVN